MLKKRIPEKDYHIYDALAVLMQITEKRQSEYKHEEYNRDFLSWSKEFCTIKVGAPRCTGHTESVLRLIFEDRMNIGYITGLKHDNAKHFKSLYNDKIQKQINRYGYHEWEYVQKRKIGELSFCLPVNRIKDKLIGSGIKNKVDAFVIDNSSFLSKNNIETIYQVGSLWSNPVYNYNAGKNFYYIFLQ